MRFLLIAISAAAMAAAQQPDPEFAAKYAEKNAAVRRHWQAKQFDSVAQVLEDLRRDPRLLLFPEERMNVLYNLARVYSWLGKKEEAIRYLRESAKAGYGNFRQVERDPDLENIRQEAGYREALAEIRAAGSFWDGHPVASEYRESLNEEERIAGLSKFWADVKYNFAWFDHVPGLNWDAAYLEFLPKARQAKNTLEYYLILRQMCARLKDGHTYINPPWQVSEQLDWKPPLRTTLIEDKVLVTELLDPALEKQGIRTGLEIEAVNGVPVREHAEKNVRPYQSASTPQGLRQMTYDYGLLAGERAMAVSIRFRDEQGGAIERSLLRQVNRYADRRALLEFKVLEGNIGYLALNSFNDGKIVALFEEAFEKIAGTDALIIDLRANPGGNEGNSRRILACFFDQPFRTTIRSTRQNRAYERAHGQILGWYVWPPQMLQPHGSRYYRKPLAVLAGARTGSAAEDFLSSFEIMKRAAIVGEPTCGSTGQPLFTALPGGGSAAICTSRSQYPDGGTFVGAGIQPQIGVRPTVADVRAGRDVVLAAAVKHLRKVE